MTKQTIKSPLFVSVLAWAMSRVRLFLAPLVCASFAVFLTPASASSPAIIDAIMGGGIVVGTECVNGVVSPEYQSSEAITDFGPGTTLFVKDAGKTRLRKGSGSWIDGTGFNNDDEVVFSLIDGNNTNQRHYIVDGTAQNNLIAEFGSASGGSASVPDGQGEYTMEFVPATGNSGDIQVLGTIYRATLTGSEWTCVDPGLVAPETPVIQSANPLDNGATLVLAPDADQVIEQYTVQLSRPGTVTEFEVPIAGGGTGTLTVEERTSERTVVSFVGSGITNGETWAVKIKAENGNGTNVSAFSNSVEFIPGAAQCDQVADWSAAASEAGWTCDVNGETYEYADFHILTSNDTGVCAAPASYLPTDDGNGQGTFCEQEGNTVRAIYDWKNGFENNEKHELTWLASVEQIGSRSGTGCGALGSTAAGRCANQLKEGQNAFRGMAGAGGSAIENLDTSNLNNIEHIFRDASQFNQNVSTKLVTVNDESFVAWDISGVDRINSAFWGATSFNNGDAPLYWDTQSVFNMGYTFAESGFNQDISTQQVTIDGITFTAWNTSQVRFLDNAFNEAKAFNQNLSSWNTSKIETLENTFKFAAAFNNGEAAGASNQPLNWTTSALERINYAFAHATSFNQKIFADGNNTAKVENMAGTFKEATVFNQDIGGWDTGRLTKTPSMFYGASSFNQDLSSWNVAAVNNNSNFDEGASAWCGTGFNNRGRPSDWEPSLATGCPADVETFVSLEAPPSAVAGDELTYELSYWNSSNAITNGNTLVLTLPTDVTLPPGADLSGGTASGGTVTWNNVQVPGGTTSESGGKILVTGIVGSAVANGTELTAEAEITDDGNNTINDQATVTVTSKAILQVTLSADPYVLPGDEITYQVTVENVGKSDTTANLTLKWDAESGIVPASSTDAGCNGTPLECNWAESLQAGEDKSRPITVKMAADAALQASVLATASASAPNAAESDQSAASAETEVAGSAALNLTLSSLPQKMVKPGGTVVYSLLLSNVGNDKARDTLVKLPIPAGAVATVPAGASCTGSPCEGATLEWNGLEVEDGQSSDPLTVTVTAPSSEGGLTLQASADGRSALTDLVVETTSNEAVLQVAERPAVELTASFASNEFQPNGQLNLRFNYENVGTAASEPGVLRFNVPTHTVLKSWPQGASCDDALCSDGFAGKVTLPVPALSENSAARSTDSADFTLQTLPEATSVTVNAALRPDEIGDFLPTVASTETALLRSEPALPVPTLPWAALLTLLGLISGLGYRRLRLA